MNSWIKVNFLFNGNVVLCWLNIVAFRWPSLGAGTCRDRPIQMSVWRPPPSSPHTPRARLFTDTEMSLATRSNQFRICMRCLDSGSSRFIESMSLYYLSILVLLNLYLHASFEMHCICCTIIQEVKQIWGILLHQITIKISIKCLIHSNIYFDPSHCNCKSAPNVALIALRNLKTFTTQSRLFVKVY